MIYLPSSIGEALDKLSILEIKMENIKNKHIVKEYNMLQNILNLHITNNQCDYYYKILKDINLQIWNLQQETHNNNIEMYEHVLRKNDQRFRIKQKINRITNSNIIEEKSYKKQKCLVYTHLGLGDMIWMNGAIRYLSTLYDEVWIVCKTRNLNNVLEMYSDDETIKLFEIKDDSDILPFNTVELEFKNRGFDVYSCGLNVGKDVYDLPNSFYDNLNIERNIRSKYFYYPKSIESLDLFNIVKPYIPYIFIHQQSLSNREYNIYNKFQNDNRLIIDPNENHYTKDHRFYDINEKIINKPIGSYIDIIENAEELHMIESSFYCLSCHLNLKAKIKLCYNPYAQSAERIGIFKTGI